MFEKILWTALVTACSALAGAIAVRVADKIWRGIRDEPPPEVPGWSKLLIGRPMKKQLGMRLGAPPTA